MVCRCYTQRSLLHPDPGFSPPSLPKATDVTVSLDAGRIVVSHSDPAFDAGVPTLAEVTVLLHYSNGKPDEDITHDPATVCDSIFHGRFLRCF